MTGKRLMPRWACCALIGLAAGTLAADPAAETTRTARGGTLVKSGQAQFEVLFDPTGVRVFARDAAGKALDASRLTATATFHYPGSTKPWFTRTLRPAGPGAGSLTHAINLRTMPASGATVTFDIQGLPDPDGSAAHFTVPFAIAQAPATAAAPRAPATRSAAAAPAARYVYRSGYQGYGYYSYTGTERPAAAASSYRSSGSSRSFDASHRDWSTDRDNLPISKPWLRPLD